MSIDTDVRQRSNPAGYGFRNYGRPGRRQKNVEKAIKQMARQADMVRKKLK
jgi:hypothetical protein